MKKWFLKPFFVCYFVFAQQTEKHISITVLLTSMCSIIKLEEIRNTSEDVPHI